MIKRTVNRCLSLARKVSRPVASPLGAAVDSVHLRSMGLIHLLMKSDKACVRFLWDPETAVTDDQLLTYLTEHGAVASLGNEVLLRIYQQCSAAGLMMSARYVKERVAEKMSRRSPLFASNAALFDIATASIFMGDYPRAVTAAGELVHRNMSPEQRWRANELRAFASLLNGDSASAQVIWDGQIPLVGDTAAFRRFKHYCRDRTIAIVGPADAPTDVGDEIDRHDVVIRMNHFLSKPIAKAGTKTDVVYHNGQVVRENREQVERELAKFDFVVLRSEELKRPTASGNLPLVLPPYDILYRAVIMGVQRILIDVLRHHPKSIKLFNVDFYTRPKAYADNYVGTVHRQRLSDKAVNRHDLVQNFLMVKTAVEKGVLRADADVAEILALSKYAYLKRVTSLYGARPAPDEETETS